MRPSDLFKFSAGIALISLSPPERTIQALFDDLNRDALRYQELYYTERKHISHLDEQRCAGYSTGDQLPA